MKENLSKYGDTATGGMAVESSAAGLNDNLEFMGRQLHVQTERMGFPVPHIVTQVFSNGRVVFSKKSDIPPRNRESQESADIQALMRSQHFQTIREIADKEKRILSARQPSRTA